MGMDIYGECPRAPTGEYFRASIWSWPPILTLVVEANERFALGVDLFGFDCNSGYGLGSQEECDRLAKALETILAETDFPVFTLDVELRPAEAATLGALQASGWEIETPAYSTDREHVEEFVAFLRECGGFRIW